MKALVIVGVAACAPLDTAATSEPATCEGCHPDQTREWASSMHAYASDDPVFIAMNRRGQRETSGALGTFCTRCHAPMGQRGVGCIACHQVSDVEATHNGGLQFERGGTMRGGLHAPEDNPAHDSSYSELLDARTPSSSKTCGACHDVVLQNGLAIENTYAEWSASIFSQTLSCAGCHMFPLGPRRHEHAFPGVDIASSPWPGVAEQQQLVARDLRAALITKLCVLPAGGGVQVDVTLDNAQVGHAFPSGTTHARRLSVELDGETVWTLGSRFTRSGSDVQFAWDADGIESELLMPSVTLDPRAPGYYHARTRSFQLVGRPDMIKLTVHEQPIAVGILQDLVDSGDLDPAVIGASVTHSLEGATREWHSATGFGCVP